MAHELSEPIQLPNGQWVVIDTVGANKGQILINKPFPTERAATRAARRRSDAAPNPRDLDEGVITRDVDVDRESRIPPIPEPRPGASRLDLMLENLGTAAREDPLGLGEAATAGIPIVGDVIGTAAGVERFSKDPSVEEAIFTALGIAPFVSGAVIKDLVGPRLKKLIEEFNQKDAEIVQASGQQVRLDSAINQVDDAQTLFRSQKIPADVDIDEVTRMGLKKRLQKKIDAISIEDPFTGELTTARDLGEEGLLGLRAELRGKSRALEMRRGILEKEFERLGEVQASLAETSLKNQTKLSKEEFLERIQALFDDPTSKGPK